MQPDFIGIGAQKAATTWLYQILKVHPKVWLPPAKELQYFNYSEDEDSHLNKIIFRKRNYKMSLKRLRFNPFKDIIWSCNYLLKKRNLVYYFNLFKPCAGQICGEISPGYDSMDITKIKKVKEALPKVKIIYLLRNPIQRDWSSICMYCERELKREIAKCTINELIDLAEKRSKRKQSAYAKNLENWKQFFDSSQIFIGYYEDIQQNPEDFIKKIYAFLELKPISKKLYERFLNNKINSFSKTIPLEVEKTIALNQYDNIKAIHKLLDNQYTNAWLKKVESILY